MPFGLPVIVFIQLIKLDLQTDTKMTGYSWRQIKVNRLALKSGIDSHPESPQVCHSWPANTSQRLNSVYMVASSD